MSQMATARALPRLPSARQRSAARGDLVVVTGAPSGHAGLVAAALVLLTAGLVSVLLLNTWMAQSAFTLTALQQRSEELKDTESALRHAIDAQSAPAELAKRALEQGMVPASTAAFLRLSDGQVLGVAEPATGERGFTVVAQAVPSAPAADSATSPGAASSVAANVPLAGTTVATEGTITRTTVVAVTADTVETTVTSVDSATGATTSKTTRVPLAAAAAPVAAAPTP